MVGCLVVCFVSACSDDRVVRQELLEDCVNHYRATSFQVAQKTCLKAAKSDIVEAQWLLANIYEYDLTGQGAEPEKAFQWYLSAAEGGMAEAQTIVGDAYLYARGVAEDFEKAYSWFNKAAQGGDANAEFSIGYMFFTGKGRVKDISSAISWFKKAAHKEHSMSINNLAWIYATSKEAAFLSVKKAQFWAEKLMVDGGDSAVFLDTKAAVYALAGEFSKAIELQHQAIANLPENVEEERLLEFQKHLETYQQNQAWQE